MIDHPTEPFRIKSIETIRLISREKRQVAMKEAGYNLFALRADANIHARGERPANLVFQEAYDPMNPHPDTGEMVYPKLELVRLALPRRVYTQSHIDYVVQVMVRLAEQKEKLVGYRLVYAPPLLRHFTAHLEPLTHTQP